MVRASSLRDALDDCARVGDDAPCLSRLPVDVGANMPFSSYEFLFAFLPLTFIGLQVCRRLTPRQGALAWLVFASLIFQLWAGWRALAIAAASITLTYAIVRCLLGSDPGHLRYRRILFWAGVAADIAVLGYFKYRNFFQETPLAAGTEFGMLLPLGLSFLTFQKIALLADVYAGRVQTVKTLEYALFALFFPRTLAGPIVRYEEVVPQFSNVARVAPSDILVAVCLFSIGLFKKTVIADNLEEIVWPTFDGGQPTHTLLTAWAAALGFTLQIYFDFSGYSDMALGVARLFGVRLPMNFNSPLKATSIVEFWSRWHITLTRFLTGYIYTPILLHWSRVRAARGKPVLQGKRSTLGTVLLLAGVPTLVTMTIAGVWHGAAWQFVIWGGLHGIYLTINHCWRMFRPRVWSNQRHYELVMKPCGWLLTFLAVVVAHVFFRARSVDDALQILGGMAGMNGILPRQAQLLQTVGVDPLVALIETDPYAPFPWIAALLACILLLPNSLELLRHFEPALDFRAGSKVVPSAHKWFAPHWRSILQPQTAALLAALLGTIGAMAISASGAFLYRQF